MTMVLKLFSLLMCASFALTIPATGGEVYEEEIDIAPIGVTGSGSHEELVASLEQLVTFVEDSCDRMMESAEQKGAAALQIATQTRDQNAARLEELKEMDFDALPDDELQALVEEVSNLITVFREARDAIDELD